MSATLAAETDKVKTGKALLSTTEAIGNILGALPNVDITEFADMLRSYLVAPEEEEEKEELMVSLRELIDPDGRISVDTVSLNEWERNLHGEAQALVQNKKAFANKLTRLMQAAGLNQKELASRLNVTQSCISQFASGKHKPQPETLQKLAKALECNIEDLWPPEAPS